jgi:cardiolipin synthase
MVGGLGLFSSEWLPGLGDDRVPFGMYLVYVGMVLSVSAAAQYTVRALRARRAAIDATKGDAA